MITVPKVQIVVTVVATWVVLVEWISSSVVYSGGIPLSIVSANVQPPHPYHHHHHPKVDESITSTFSSSTSTSTSLSLPPNFVIILTDDLDWTLGGTHASTLRRTREWIAEQGKTFTNWFVQTPVCCPSRAELLTGKFFHNLRLPSGQKGEGGCMHVDVASNASHPFYQRDYFASYFQQLNYTVGIFGKHLNNANPTDFLPNGVDEMLINDGGVYLDPTFTVGTRGTRPPHQVTFNNCTETTGMPCYSTSVIGNASLAWIQRHRQQQLKQQFPHTKPFLALISLKAPHILDGPDFPISIPAPWYQNTTIPEQMAPRTPNYNYSATDHHWVVRSQLPMTQEEAERVDALYVSRLKTLLSVDDLVDALIPLLDLNNTYLLFTSDNGYRLGQFRMPMCKLHPYENDIRVPMMIRGPKIRKNTTSNLLATHVDLMPTLLGLVTNANANANDDERKENIPIPETMDGTNLASCILDESSTTKSSCSSSHSTFLLMEYMSLGTVFRYNHTVDTYNHSFLAIRMMMPQPEISSNDPTLSLHNLKYVEYRDSRWDWNATQPPLEQELFDLDKDPYELHNILSTVSPLLVQTLQFKLQRLFHCRGDICRQERQQQQQQQNDRTVEHYGRNTGNDHMRELMFTVP